MHTYSKTLLGQQLHDALHANRVAILGAEPNQDALLDFACSTVAGLSDLPRRMECRFLYDEQGSKLFERITEQPEYYLTRTEAALLAAHADRIREVVGAATLAELGSGSSTKTDILLRAWLAREGVVRYVPVDVSQSALSCACHQISAEHRAVRVVGVHADYASAFPLLQVLSPALVLFLGSSIGNFSPKEMKCFLSTLAVSLNPGDFFLVGVDLVKEDYIINAAYNDAAGVTAAFTRNLFARMNRELGSDINLNAIQHVARYVPAHEQVEIAARFTRSQTIEVASLERSFLLEQGEEVQTEISRKFCLERFIPYLERFGFSTEQVFTDPKQWFALLLLRRTNGSNGGRS